MWPDELMGPPECGYTLLQQSSELLLGRILPRRKADQPCYYGKNIFDPVTELAGQNFVLGRKLLGIMNVGAGPDPPNDLSLVPPHGQRSSECPTILAAMMPKPILDFVGLAGLEAFPPDFPGTFLVVRVKHAVPSLAVGRTGRNASKFIPSGVIIVMVAVRQSGPDHVGQGIGQGAEGGVALAQCISSRNQLCLKLLNGNVCLHD